MINLTSGGIIKCKKGEKHMQSVVFEHFSSNGYNGFLEDAVSLLLTKQMGLIPLKERNSKDEL